MSEMADYPPEFREYVRSQVASGRYQSERELFGDALRLMQARDEYRRQEIHEKISRGTGQLDRGEAIELDEQSLGLFFDQIHSEVQTERIAKGGAGE